MICWFSFVLVLFFVNTQVLTSWSVMIMPGMALSLLSLIMFLFVFCFLFFDFYKLFSYYLTLLHFIYRVAPVHGQTRMHSSIRWITNHFMDSISNFCNCVWMSCSTTIIANHSSTNLHFIRYNRTVLIHSCIQNNAEWFWRSTSVLRHTATPRSRKKYTLVGRRI